MNKHFIFFICIFFYMSCNQVFGEYLIPINTYSSSGANPGNACDGDQPIGNIATGWQPLTKNSTEYITFEFNDIKCLSDIVINFNYSPYSFSVYGSNDNVSFTPIAPWSSSSSFCNSKTVTISLGYKNYKFLKIGNIVMSYQTTVCSNPVNIVNVAINGISLCETGTASCSHVLNTSDKLRVQTTAGYLDLGPQNPSYAHLQTNMPKFYFNKPIVVSGDLNATAISSNSGNLLLKTAGTTRLTINTDGSVNFTKDIKIPLNSRFICGDFTTGINMFYSVDYMTSYIDFSPGNLYFRSANGSPIVLQNNGNVGIGMDVKYSASFDHTQGYKLAVNGGILCEEVKVITNVPASDYVFENNYNLLSLKEVEEYVMQHKHLPEVPSAQEFKENGYKVGEMDDLLLRKVEELTLYIIEQQKLIDQQAKKLKLLEDLVLNNNTGK